jgi:hypothetical protein
VNSPENVAQPAPEVPPALHRSPCATFSGPIHLSDNVLQHIVTHLGMTPYIALMSRFWD